MAPALSCRMRKVILVVLTIIAAAVAQLCPSPASAAQLRCASHELTTSDEDEAFDRARRAMPKASGEVSLEFGCWNPDFAVASFRTPAMVDTDGVRWWWSARCRRAIQAWSCEAASQERQIDVTISQDGKPIKVVADLAVGFPAARARSLVTASAALSSRMEMPLPGCTRSPGDASSWRNIREHPFPMTWDPEAEITRTEVGAYVDYLNSRRFRFDNNDRAVCWEAIVVVD